MAFVAAMIDLETLGRTKRSAILTMGCVKFNPFMLDEPYSPLYIKPTLEDQIELGMEVDDETVAWWATQPEDAKEEAFSDTDRVPLELLFKDFSRYINGVNEIWCQGAGFDTGIIEHLYELSGRSVPWNYFQVRDSRTILKMCSNYYTQYKTMNHHALHDAYAQAKGVIELYNRFGLTWST